MGMMSRVGEGWSHPSLKGPRPEYSVAGGMVKKGDLILAFLKPRRNGTFSVTAPGGKRLGTVSTPAEAMVMLVRIEEGKEV